VNAAGTSLTEHAGPAVNDGKKGHQLGVKVSWLQGLVTILPRKDMKTSEVVDEVIKPATLDAKCRYADLSGVRNQGAIGDADAFLSHCWNGLFVDLVAGAAHVLPHDAFVWVDIFAVNQHEKKEDIDFVKAMSSCGSFVLVSKHLQSVADMKREDAHAKKISLVPEEERKSCAFWRVWCLVELAAALSASLPVVLLAGSAEKAPDGHLKFVVNTDMDKNLPQLLDAADAFANDQKDIPSLMDALRPVLKDRAEMIEVTSKLNRITRGCLAGAFDCMEEPKVLQAVVGEMGPLLALPKKEMGKKMISAAAGGYLSVVNACLKGGADASAPDAFGQTSLMLAAGGGHLTVVEALLGGGANANKRDNNGYTALMFAAQGGHLAVVEALIQSGADAAAVEVKRGWSTLMLAARDGHPLIVEALLAAGADPSTADFKDTTALMLAKAGGHTQVVQLLESGAKI